MPKKEYLWAILLGMVLLTVVSTARAQDSGPIINLLLQKGLINFQEAEELRADMARDTASGVMATISGRSNTLGLTISGRLQAQFAGLDTQVSGAADPASTNHFFLRRVYLGAKANLGNGWGGTLNYDFAGSTFDAAYLTWRKDNTLSVDVGLRKVPIGLEEWYTSSSSLKAIERSPVTRYFVEGNNGRRLGAGSYRIGAYAGGTLDNGIFYNVAITNPERDESSSGAAGTGGSSNNNFAYWANLGYTGDIGEDLTYTLSGSVGYLPDQGGKVLGAGNDLRVYNAFAEVTRGLFDLQLEAFAASNENGVSATQDASPFGFSIQPALQVNNIEYVLRYSYVDSDGRGVNLSDGIRSAPGGGTMDRMTEWFGGLTYYFRGNDVKWQVGYIFGESKDTVTGGTAKARTEGVRSQMQVNF